MKRSITVNIAGQRYVLKSDADAQYVHELAAYVSEKFKQVNKTTKHVATHQVAILAAMQIADALFRERRGRSELRRRVKEQSQKLLHVIAREAQS